MFYFFIVDCGTGGVEVVLRCRGGADAGADVSGEGGSLRDRERLTSVRTPHPEQPPLRAFMGIPCCFLFALPLTTQTPYFPVESGAMETRP